MYFLELELETPRGNKTVIDYYLPSSGGYFCSVSDGGIKIVYDNIANKMFTYMGTDDDKLMTSIPFNLKRIVKENNDWEDPRVTKTAGYASILGYDCDLYKMVSDNLISEIWVATDFPAGFVGTKGSFAENAGSEFFGYILGRSSAVNDDSLEAMYAGIPLQIKVTKKRGRREKISTWRCLKFEKEHYQINTAEYQRL